MTFAAAVASCLRNYAVFEGRAGPGEYWWFGLFCAMCTGAVLAANILLESMAITFAGALGLTVLALALPSLAVTVRRLHDSGLSGLWLLMALVPVVGAVAVLVLILRPGETGPNRFGPPVGGRPDLVRFDDLDASYDATRIPRVRQDKEYL